MILFITTDVKTSNPTIIKHGNEPSGFITGKDCLD
jgi:hypothetical protein